MEVVQLMCHKDGRTWSERKSFNILICFATSCSTIEAAHGLELPSFSIRIAQSSIARTALPKACRHSAHKSVNGEHTRASHRPPLVRCMRCVRTL